MTVWDHCFLFLDSPRGGVEDMRYVAERNPWVRSVFVNVRDYPASTWATVRERARAFGITCGPWARMTQPGSHTFDESILRSLIAVADLWAAPLIVNAEKELDGSGARLTSKIEEKLGNREAAISMETWPFDSVDWRPLANRPILPQIFPAESPTAKDPIAVKRQWHLRGARLVYFTNGTYSTQTPLTYNLQAPYSLFPGDPLLATYSLEAWRPTSYGFDPTDGADLPPSAASLAPIYRAKIAELAREWENLEPSSTPGSRITVVRRIIETTGSQWNGARGGIIAELDETGVPQ